MGSKKNKKTKQEEVREIVEIDDSEKPTKINKRKRQLEIQNDEIPQTPVHKKKRQFEEIVNNNQNEIDLSSPLHELKKEVVDIEAEGEVDLPIPVKSKKKKKHHKSGGDINPLELSECGEEKLVTDIITKQEKIKREVTQIEIEEVKIEPHIFPQRDQSIHKEVSMPQNDLLELIRRMYILIPENDFLSYKCRADKLQWDDIAFSHYSAAECKENWFILQKSIRRFRILKEVLEDAKSFVMNPSKVRKVKKVYPGMPQKPPTSYQLFYKKKKPALLSNEPGLDFAGISRRISQMFRNLSPENRRKYEKQASQLKTKYDAALQTYYEIHPEFAESMKKDKLLEYKPARPSTPFMLYYKNWLRKNGNSDSNDDSIDIGFKDQCRTQWKQLSMKKKMLWITKAERDVVRYEEEMKEYILRHPNYNHIPVKSILTKEEKMLKERYLGKPNKPPNSAYSLFSTNLLQSDEIKKINYKDRMNHIAAQWKICTDEEKSQYKAKVDEMMEQYRKDYEKYLESLPEDKKQMELEKNAPKKKSENTDKKKKLTGKSTKISEPPTPPISAFRYFAISKSIDDRKIAKKEWKKLSDEEKSEYEKKLVEIKRNYILQFEKFLNSLSKEELQEFSKTKQELKFNSEDFEGDTTSSSSEGDDSDIDE